jgi:threonine/homoserine/homoserine lactone efflux protein
MLNELAYPVSSFWVIFSFSFLVALTGAMAPGPLLTYTIIKSAHTHDRGYLMGLWIITGHALLEMGIIFLLLLGFSFFLKNIIVIRTIGIVGGLLLVWFGATIVRDVRRGSICPRFLNESCEKSQEFSEVQTRGLQNPIIGGAMISMSNPYWWIWWATIGLAFMVQFEISFRHWPKLLAFFLGHEAGDLIWYLLISTLSFFGLRYLNQKLYHAFLIFCGLFMMVFGFYLGTALFFKNSL